MGDIVLKGSRRSPRVGSGVRDALDDGGDGLDVLAGSAEQDQGDGSLGGRLRWC